MNVTLSRAAHQYYSYGNKGNDGIGNGSSIGKHVHKKFVKVISSEKSAFDAKSMEEFAAQEISIGITSQYKVIPKL